jgi:hypothetical protein
LVIVRGVIVEPSPSAALTVVAVIAISIMSIIPVAKMALSLFTIRLIGIPPRCCLYSVTG